MDAPLLLMSFLVGILIGLTSMGGAALMTPFLILFMGIRPVMAVGTDLAYGAITKIVGAAVHWRQKTVDVGVALRLASGSIPGAMAGLFTIHHLERKGVNVDQYLRTSLGVVLVIVALGLIFRAFTSFPSEHAPPKGEISKWLTPAWGAAVGYAVGLTSVGSGSLIAPFLMFFFPMTAARVVGTDVFHAAILVTASAAFYSGTGRADMHLAANMLLGSVPGVIIGSQLAPRLPQRTMRFVLGVVLLATGARMV